MTWLEKLTKDAIEIAGHGWGEAKMTASNSGKQIIITTAKKEKFEKKHLTNPEK